MKKLLLLALLVFGTLSATIINVPSDPPTIQSGIDFASEGDTVLVAGGTYYENINYNGKNIVVGSLFLTTQDTSYISSTIIDGNQSGSVVYFTNGSDSTAVLSGFTIQNGSRGITIYGSPKLENVIIADNSSAFGGGINIGSYSSPMLKNIIIANNYCDWYGGGILVHEGSHPVLVNCILWNNSPEQISFDYDSGYGYGEPPPMPRITVPSSWSARTLAFIW